MRRCQSAWALLEALGWALAVHLRCWFASRRSPMRLQLNKCSRWCWSEQVIYVYLPQYNWEQASFSDNPLRMWIHPTSLALTTFLSTKNSPDRVRSSRKSGNDLWLNRTACLPSFNHSSYSSGVIASRCAARKDWGIWSSEWTERRAE